MKRETKERSIHLSPEADDIIERRREQTGLSKRTILDRIVMEKAKRWYPEEVKE